MRLIRGQENHLAALQAMRLAGDADFRLAFEHLDERVERNRVFLESLPLIKSEERHTAGGLLHDFAIDSGMGLVAHALSYPDPLAAGEFF